MIYIIPTDIYRNSSYIIFATMNQNLRSFTRIAFLEGLSYILLLLIAMPLKYFFDMPQAVKYVGWAHGVLFVAYVALLVVCGIQYKWSFKRMVFYFIASLLPFVPFFVERKLKQEYAGTEVK